MLVTCQRLGDLFLFGLQFRQNIIKVGSKLWLLICRSNITLSLPTYTGSALKRELNFCNGCIFDKFGFQHSFFVVDLAELPGSISCENKIFCEIN